MDWLEVMSTRLFPKNQGAGAYVLNGIAGRCDWVVASDMQEPHALLVQRVLTDSPRHVFLSMRSPFARSTSSSRWCCRASPVPSCW
jgi:hypothetical protein